MLKKWWEPFSEEDSFTSDELISLTLKLEKSELLQVYLEHMVWDFFFFFWDWAFHYNEWNKNSLWKTFYPFMDQSGNLIHLRVRWSKVLIIFALWRRYQQLCGLPVNGHFLSIQVPSFLEFLELRNTLDWSGKNPCMSEHKYIHGWKRKQNFNIPPHCNPTKINITDFFYKPGWIYIFPRANMYLTSGWSIQRVLIKQE